MALRSAFASKREEFHFAEVRSVIPLVEWSRGMDGFKKLARSNGKERERRRATKNHLPAAAVTAPWDHTYMTYCMRWVGAWERGPHKADEVREDA